VHVSDDHQDHSFRQVAQRQRQAHRKYQQAIAEWSQTLRTIDRIAEFVVEHPELQSPFSRIRAGCPREGELNMDDAVESPALPVLAQLEKRPYTMKTMVRLNQHCKQLTRRYTQVSGLRAGFSSDAMKRQAQMDRHDASAAHDPNIANRLRRFRYGCIRWFKMSVAIVFTIIALVLEFCEVTIPASAKLCPLAFMRSPTGFQVGAALVFFSLLWTMTCQLLFFMNIPRYYHVAPNHHTDENSLLYMAGNFLNVAAPLTYNFHALSKAESTAFFEVIGSMKVVPFLGSGVHSGLPILIVVISIITIPHLLQRFCNCLPFLRSEEDDDEISLVDYGVYGDRDEETITIREGQNLIDTVRRLQQREAEARPNPVEPETPGADAEAGVEMSS